jgi:hypothetical protein
MLLVPRKSPQNMGNPGVHSDDSGSDEGGLPYTDPNHLELPPVPDGVFAALIAGITWPAFDSKKAVTWRCDGHRDNNVVSLYIQRVIAPAPPAPPASPLPPAQPPPLPMPTEEPATAATASAPSASPADSAPNMHMQPPQPHLGLKPLQARKP